MLARFDRPCRTVEGGSVSPAGRYKLSDLWGKSPEEIVQCLAEGMGDGEAYGDWGNHVVAILQAKVAEQVSKRNRWLVWGTWALVAVNIALAVTVWIGR